MTRTLLALVAAATTAASAQQVTPPVTTPVTTIYGHPLHTPIPPAQPLSRLKPQPLLNQRGPVRTFIAPAYLYNYNPYAQYAQPAETNVSVNVTNVLPAPEILVFPTGQYAGGNYIGGQLWNPVSDQTPPDTSPQPVREPAAVPAMHPGPGLGEPADVGTLDATVGALYDVISGPPGKDRDWDRFRTLFADGARLIATVSMPGLPARATVMTPDEYATNASPLLRRGFVEKEVSRTVEQFGRIAQVFSTYESRYRTTDAKPFQRGINSIQLLNDGTRWWIVSVYWDAERSDNPIPAKYLTGKQ